MRERDVETSRIRMRGVHADGRTCCEDFAGSGGGTTNPDLVARLTRGDRTSDAPTSPRSVLRSAYWRTDHEEPREDEILKSLVGDDGYPGDAAESANWPGMAPGTRGILNALSPRYCNWADMPDWADKPPVLWTHGGRDIVVADGSPWEMGTLGSLGAVPGWPGADALPPQPVVAQIRAVLERYRDAGGRVEIEIFEESGHAPFLDAAERWSAVFFGFLESVA